MKQLEQLKAGMPIVYGGNRVTTVSKILADSFSQGDRLIVDQTTGDLLHVPENVWQIAQDAVAAAANAFAFMGDVTDDQISTFYETFARNLEAEASFAPIAANNASDVANAKERGRSTTRLLLDDGMRKDMIAGLRMWRDTSSERGKIVETVEHVGWRVDQVRTGLGPVGFVFEGRPNVFADACGVIRHGNTVVFRIGSDALLTAKAIVEHALNPAIRDAGLPVGAVSLVATASRAAGWAMFSDSRLGLAVARGSGAAVAQLGAVARQAGLPVSLHGTGGAWIIAAETADTEKFTASVVNSLDRKTCNTLNTCAIVATRQNELIPAFLDALQQIQDRQDVSVKLHVVEGHQKLIPDEWFEERAISRAEGEVVEQQTELISGDRLGEEWEWERSPEVTLTIVPNFETAINLFNEQSPRFAASLISESTSEHQRFFDLIDSPFVGNGMTRWVDGQYALNRPELGLSNWQFGRLFGRGGILSGDSVYTVRTRATQENPDLGR